MANREGYMDPTAERAVGRVARSEKRRRSLQEQGPVRAGSSPASGTAGGREYVGKHVKHVPLIYVCSRFRGRTEAEVAELIRRARMHSRFVLSRQGVPVAPHLLYPQFLRDSLPMERELGIRCGLKLLHQCEELWAFVSGGISDGMRRELEEARVRKIPVRFFDENYQEVGAHERCL